ncbi:MAG: Single-stranded nucleic acid binding R3H domain protein [candidate division WS6 bacterium GW2011_GWF2_39_15]|uniref:Single-stranded nucleic acid binding R3H domain protein n=1 Tax=candidate division WS6 bacterium GW2011_GWF2_39_15 TaxID=1619100 RepID=A0A0G0MN38_9BACT|nr:MAG: Single-stranded nucleic acid binding R3H domain protein [candidate division WS6 bacterium GW2011_GWF2_39_15]
MSRDNILELVKKETAKLLDLIGIAPEVAYTFADNSTDEFVVVDVSIKGDDLGFMIGNQGRHLQAFQSLLCMIVRTQLWKEEDQTRFIVTVDAGDYRKQKVDRIERIAMQKADDARILGEPVDLMPMSPADRRVVHTVLGKFDDIKTESHGEGWDRYVRIVPVTEEELGIVPESGDNADDAHESEE